MQKTTSKTAKKIPAVRLENSGLKYIREAPITDIWHKIVAGVWTPGPALNDPETDPQQTGAMFAVFTHISLLNDNRVLRAVFLFKDNKCGETHKF